jgi:hypothetical protein
MNRQDAEEANTSTAKTSRAPTRQYINRKDPKNAKKRNTSTAKTPRDVNNEANLSEIRWLISAFLGVLGVLAV